MLEALSGFMKQIGATQVEIAKYEASIKAARLRQGVTSQQSSDLHNKVVAELQLQIDKARGKISELLNAIHLKESQYRFLGRSNSALWKRNMAREIEMEELSGNVADLQEKVNFWQREYENQEISIVHLEAIITELEGQRDDAVQERSVANGGIEALNHELMETSERIKDLETSLLESQALVLETKGKNTPLQQRVQSQQTEITNLTKTLPHQYEKVIAAVDPKFLEAVRSEDAAVISDEFKAFCNHLSELGKAQLSETRKVDGQLREDFGTKLGKAQQTGLDDRAKIADLTQQVKSLTLQYEEAKQKVEAKETHVKSLTKVHKKLNATLEETLQKERDRSHQELQQVQSSRQEAVNQASGMKQENASLQAKCTVLESQVVHLDDVKSLKEAIKGFKEAIKGFKEAIKGFKDILRKVQVSLDGRKSLEDKIKTHEDTSKELKLKNKELEERYAKTAAARDELALEILAYLQGS